MSTLQLRSRWTLVWWWVGGVLLWVLSCGEQRRSDHGGAVNGEGTGGQVAGAPSTGAARGASGGTAQTSGHGGTAGVPTGTGGASGLADACLDPQAPAGMGGGGPAGNSGICLPDSQGGPESALGGAGGSGNAEPVNCTQYNACVRGFVDADGQAYGGVAGASNSDSVCTTICARTLGSGGFGESRCSLSACQGACRSQSRGWNGFIWGKNSGMGRLCLVPTRVLRRFRFERLLFTTGNLFITTLLYQLRVLRCAELLQRRPLCCALCGHDMRYGSRC